MEKATARNPVGKPELQTVTISLPKEEYETLAKDAYENFRSIEMQIRYSLNEQHKRKYDRPIIISQQMDTSTAWDKWMYPHPHLGEITYTSAQAHC